jgi:hypothetical protein
MDELAARAALVLALFVAGCGGADDAGPAVAGLAG